MRKILSILLAVVMVLSLVAPFRVNTAKAVTVQRSNDQYTGLPTYKLGEPIVGTTEYAYTDTVKLVDNSGNVKATFSVSGAGKTFFFDTSVAPLKDLPEGTYILEEFSGSYHPTNYDKKIYIQKFSLPTPNCSITPTFSTQPQNAVIWGKVFDAGTGQAVVGQDVYLAYSSDGSSWKLADDPSLMVNGKKLINNATVQTSNNGSYSFTGVNFLRYGYYGIFAYNPSAPNTNGYQPYFFWHLEAGGLSVTKVIVDATTNEIPLYYVPADTLVNMPQLSYQHAYVRITDATGSPVTNVSFSFVSGLTFNFGISSLGDGIYDIQITTSTIYPQTAGISNIKVVNNDTNAQATFSLTFKTLNPADVNPTLTMNVTSGGLNIGQTVSFKVYYNVVPPDNHGQYQIGTDKDGTTPLQFTSFESPCPLYYSGGYGEGYGFDDYTTPGEATSYNCLIRQGGQITIDAQAVLWTIVKDSQGNDITNALNTSAKEVKKVFKVQPAISGDIVTVSPTSVTVGDTKDVTVTVKTASGVERNNAYVCLYSVSGMFSAPSNAQYFVSPDGSCVYISALRSFNQNIAGGNYVFNGLKFNRTGKISVSVRYDSWNFKKQQFDRVVSADIIGVITVLPKTVTLTASVNHLVAGFTYPSITVSGAVTGLTFNGYTKESLDYAKYYDWTPINDVDLNFIDNGDGT